ncbi:MAG: tail fiber domain-containing protein [Alphaproteobacteria bacterium]
MMMLHRRNRLGFTLVELAIVLSIAGLLFVGLWRLLSGGNQQLRDQSVASGQEQVITAVKGYLASAQGQAYITAIAASTSAALTLPTTAPDGASNAGCMASIADANQKALCSYLPVGFSSATTNPYGQVYNVRVLKDAAAAGTPATTYSFMVLTSGGEVIPDISGGRVSTMIGNDGGFVYSSDVCGTALQFACGAYGAWTSRVDAYGYAASLPNGGVVATRTYVSPEQNSNLPWLARNRQIQPDASFGYNTMTTDLFMGLNGVAATNIHMAPSGVTTGGGNINMRGGFIEVQGGRVRDTTGLGQVQFTTGGAPLTTGNALINVATSCSLDAGIAIFGANSGLVGCTPGIQDVGDALFSGRVNVNSLYATTFIYQSSDIRLKMNVGKLRNQLDKIMQLNPVSFKFKSSGQDGLGVVAQDTEKVYPELVNDRGDGMKAVNYEGLIAPLISAVQELKKENDELKDALNMQKDRIRRLEKQSVTP